MKLQMNLYAYNVSVEYLPLTNLAFCQNTFRSYLFLKTQIHKTLQNFVRYMRYFLKISLWLAGYNLFIFRKKISFVILIQIHSIFYIFHCSSMWEKFIKIFQEIKVIIGLSSLFCVTLFERCHPRDCVNWKTVWFS